MDAAPGTRHTEPRPVRFLGYDMQDNRIPVDSLRAFLARQEPTLVSMLDDYLGEYRAMKTWSTPQVADTTRTRWRENAEEMLNLVTERRAGWLARRGPAATRWRRSGRCSRPTWCGRRRGGTRRSTCPIATA